MPCAPTTLTHTVRLAGEVLTEHYAATYAPDFAAAAVRLLVDLKLPPGEPELSDEQWAATLAEGEAGGWFRVLDGQLWLPEDAAASRPESR